MITEKIGFALIFILLIIGAWLSHSDLTAYSHWYAGEHALLEWLTLASLVCGIITCIYRVSILTPFRKTSFIIGLYSFMTVLLIFGALEGSRRWGIIDGIVPGWSIAVFIFAYLIILPLAYLKYPKVKKRVDNWAIPIPRGYHVVSYMGLLVIHFLTASNPQRPEQLQFGAAWLFFMVMMEPLNRVIFSRTTIER